MVTPDQALAIAFERASESKSNALVTDVRIISDVEYVCRNIQNRAGARLLLACLVAKMHRPEVDIRKPYTEIGDSDVYSGRTYDETYVTPFINQHDLPCNSTTAFLTPALRNRNTMLTPDVNLVGRPPRLYQIILNLLDDIYSERVSPHDLLAETIRWLLIVRDEGYQRRETLLAALKSALDGMPLSSEMIVRLIEQHLNQPKASRLPVLVVAAAYQTVGKFIGERHLPLYAHNAADLQTKALGDLEITFVDDDNVMTSYEMKTRKVTREDIDHVLQKLRQSDKRVDNYIFITTEAVDEQVQLYASTIYEQTNGIEFVILDCVGFLWYFLHLFHRLRVQFLEIYQELVLAEPDSAVSQPLKEVFLVLRQAAESSQDET
jgi:hypothetical protein